MTVWYLTTGGDILHGFIFPNPASEEDKQGVSQDGVEARRGLGWPVRLRRGSERLQPKGTFVCTQRLSPWFLPAETARATYHTNSTQVDSSYGNGKVFTYYSGTWRHNIRKSLYGMKEVAAALGNKGKRITEWKMVGLEFCRSLNFCWRGILSLLNTARQRTHSYSWLAMGMLGVKRL